MNYQSMLIGNKPYYTTIRQLSSFGLHWHNEIEIIYCISGGFKVKIGSTEYTVCEGETIFIESAEIHEYYKCHLDTKILLIEIGFAFLGNEFYKISELSFIDPIIGIGKNSSLSDDIIQKFYMIFKEIEATCVNSSSVNDWIIKGCLYNISALILKELPSKKKLSKERKNRMKSILNVQVAIDYISANYNFEITIDEIAHLTGYGKSNFCKHFKSATQMSFHRYLNTCRISKACILLEEQHTSVSSIGEQVGIPHTKSFCRVFKQIMGKTPTEYRESLLL